MTKIYLEQMEKIYTKRTESTGQTRATDSLANYNIQSQMNDRPTKSGNGQIETVNQLHTSHGTNNPLK